MDIPSISDKSKIVLFFVGVILVLITSYSLITYSQSFNYICSDYDSSITIDYQDKDDAVEIHQCKKYEGGFPEILGFYDRKVQKIGIFEENHKRELFKNKDWRIQMTILHELGHYQGYNHDDGGIMTSKHTRLTENSELVEIGRINNTTWSIASDFEQFKEIKWSSCECKTYFRNKYEDGEIDQETYQSVLLMLESREGRSIFIDIEEYESMFITQNFSKVRNNE